MPCAVGVLLEGAYMEQVAVLCVDGANNLVDESGIVVFCLGVIGKLCPCGIYSKSMVFAATVNSLIVLVYHILALLAVALHDEFLHLLDSEVNGDNFGNAEECALKDGVGAVAKADFLSDLGSVDIVNGDVVLCEIALDVVGEVLYEFFAVPDGVEKESTVVAQTAGNIIHTQVSLYVASHEVRSVYEVCRADRLVAETKV